MRSLEYANKDNKNTMINRSKLLTLEEFKEIYEVNSGCSSHLPESKKEETLEDKKTKEIYINYSKCSISLG